MDRTLAMEVFTSPAGLQVRKRAEQRAGVSMFWSIERAPS